MRCLRAHSAKLARTAGAAALVAALAHGQGATAQVADPPAGVDQARAAADAPPRAGVEDEQDDQQGDVVVTGSRIQRTGFNAPTPTTVLGDVELREGARPNIQQVLNDQPQFRATVTPSVSNGNTATGTAPVDLRGLGTNRTLTLLNGRRFVGQNNLNFVPAGLVERVEVVTGGASAAYGSGAVAGVVNLILKRELQGLTVGAQTGVSDRGDDRRYQFEGNFGTSFADGRGHFIVGAEYVDDKGISDRNARRNLGSAGIVRVNPTGATDLSTTLVRDVNFGNLARDGLITSGALAGQVFNGDGTLRPFRGGAQLGAAAFNGQMVGGADGVGLYDDVGALTPFARTNVYARASYDVGRATFWIDGTYGRTTSDAKFFPDYVVGPLAISAANPFLSPTVAARLAAARQTSFTLGRLFDDVFALRYDVDRKNKEGAIGVDGAFGSTWRYNAHFSHGEVRQDQQIRNSRLAANFAKAIAPALAPAGFAGSNYALNGAGQKVVCAVNADAATANDDAACVPLNPFGQGNVDPAALAYVRGTQQTFITNKLDAAAVELQGDLVQLWAGPLTVAIGGESRWESQRQTRSDLSRATPPVFGPLSLYTSDTSGRFNVQEGYGEVALPLLDVTDRLKVDFNGAARYSDYSTTGGIWSWKLGGTARLFDSLLLRTTRSRDIRSADIAELYSVRAINIGPLVDQDTAGRTGTPGYNANPQTVTTYSGGNPDLQPEVAQSFTAGGSFSPTFFRGFSVSVDYYRIKVNGYVATLSGTLLTLSCANGNAASCAQVVRDDTGTVTTVFTNNQNIASLLTRGLDLEASYATPLSRLGLNVPGSLRLRALATHVDTFTFNNGLTSVDTAGDVGDAVQRAVPKWRANFSLSYQGDAFGLDARVRYIGGGAYNHLNTTLVNNHINGRTYLDIGAQVKVASRFSLFANVNNVTDRDPPLITTGSPLYDIVGRYFTTGARVSF